MATGKFPVVSMGTKTHETELSDQFRFLFLALCCLSRSVPQRDITLEGVKIHGGKIPANLRVLI